MRNAAFLGACIGFTIANYAYQFFGAGVWATAHERTFLQLAAIVTVWLTLTWAETHKSKRR